MDEIIRLDRGQKIADALSNVQKVRAREDKKSRERKQVEKGILSDGKFAELGRAIQQKGFQDVLKTTLGTGYSEQGILRNITNEDLIEFDRKINALQKHYQGGIKPHQVINAALAIDRSRASKEIPWAHPIASRYLPAKKSLVVSFTTAASGQNGTNKHFTNVEFIQFKDIITHRLMLIASEDQARADAKALKDSLIKFDCDCGRHTYWYRYIASIGKFAYLGTNPIGREETGFPKIRNPQLKGIACKHILRTMQTILNGKGFEDFMVKAIMKQYGNLDTKKTTTTQTTQKAMKAAIAEQKGANIGVLSEGERKIAPRLLAKYRQALENGRLTRYQKDQRTKQQRLAALAKIHQSGEVGNVG